MKSSFLQRTTSALPINVNRVPVLMLWLVFCLVISKHSVMLATQANHRSEFGGSLSWSSADTLVLIYRSANGSMEQTDKLEQTFWEYVSVVGAVIDRERLTFALSDGLDSLWHHLNDPTFTTVIYAMDDQVPQDVICALSHELSGSYQKKVLFWPCPNRPLAASGESSVETISVAVGQVLHLLNVTHATVLAAGSEWILPLNLAAHLQTLRVEVDFRTSHPRTVNDVPGTAIIICGSSMDSVATRTFVQQFSHPLRNHTKVILLDAGNKMFTDVALCTRLWPPSSTPLINTTTPLSTLSGFNMLTILSTNFAKYLKLVINQGPIRSSNSTQTAAASRRLAQFQNQIKSSVDESGIELMPEIIAKIKHFYSTTPTTTGNGSSITNTDNVVEYCKQFLANNFRLDSNTTEYVCANLLLEEDDEEQDEDDDDPRRGESTDSVSALFAGASGTKTATSVVRSRCPLVVEWYALFDFIISTATIVGSSGKPTSHRVQMTVLSDDVGVYEDVDDDIDINGAAVEYNLLEYDIVAEGFAWPPVLRLKPFTSHPHRTIGGRGSSGKHENEIVSRGTSSSIGRVYSDWMSGGLNMFWQCGAHCWTVTLLISLMFLMSVFGSIVAVIAIRNYLLKQRLSKGPNKIVLAATDFVFPVEGRRVDEGIEAMLCCWLQQLQEFGGPEVDKPDLLKGSIGSLKNLAHSSSVGPSTKPGSGSTSLSKHRHMLDMRARYNGDLVQLKEIPIGPSHELRSKAMDHLVMTHGLRHENINPLIGWLNDPTRNAIVFEFCSRGSLQDVLIMDEIKLDWSFRLSLLTDLVRGMRYLHASPLRVHGSLTSRNCVVDARWVLKITDYGLQAFKDNQGIAVPPRTAKELLWTAPEIVRNIKSNAKIPISQAGDVFSFGIIMQEVVVRGEPYCMLSLTPEEIVAKIKRPPPLIRPSVSKGAAPPEAINIMRQCWAENPQMRPDFHSIFERFKLFSNGRKVNFVDTMFQMLEKYSNNLEELIRERTAQLEMERKKTEQLLNRMLPSSVAEKLKMGLSVEPEEFADVTIYFSDIVGFTTIAAHCSPVQVVDLLNDLYTCFDATINAYSVYKVETIGDAYMVVSGLPVRIGDHAEQIATMALDLLHQSGNFQVKHLPDVPLQLRIGLHTGPCCAGVVGLTMPRYCLFGDTVNTASRMESTGSSWRIHLSEITRDRLVKAGGYLLEPRGPVEIKGKGLMNTYWLLGKKGFEKVLPNPPPIGNSISIETTDAITPNPSKTSPFMLGNQSSSQSSSVCGECLDVKVEITPPRDNDLLLPFSNSFSMESSAPMNLCLNLADFNTTSNRKISELGQLQENLHTSSTSFGRFTSPTSSANSANKLYKKIEELIDLSSPYNHYRCLSPSESNLTQCTTESRYCYSGGLTRAESRPGSSRLLRRQFSLDRDDSALSQTFRQNLEIPQLQEPRTSPTNQRGTGRLMKQNSASVAIDLEKIEEIPISPTSVLSSNRHSGSCMSSQTSEDQDHQHTSLRVVSPSLGHSPRHYPGNNKSPQTNTSNEISLTVDALIVR